MIKRDIYLIILVFGAVFAFLALVENDSQEQAATILFLTFFTIGLIRLADEYLFFRSSNAVYATSLFIFIPSGMALAASVIAYISPWFAGDYLHGHMYISIVRPGEYEFFINSFALIFGLPFYSIVVWLMYKYFNQEYRVSYIARKRFSGRFASLIYSAILLGFSFAIWLYFSIIEITSLLFALTLVSCLLYFYLWPPIHSMIQTAIPNIQRQPSRRTPSAFRSISNNPRSSSRSFPGSSNPRPAQRRTYTPPAAPVAAVSPGLDVPSTNPSSPGTAPQRRFKRAQPSRTSNTTGSLAEQFLPAGNAIALDDFRCIFCYELPKSSDNLVLCPHCKRPAHSHEFNKWKSSSSLCSRCNQDIRRKPPIQINGKEYIRMIKNIQKNA